MATEVLTGYTEVDPNSHLAVSATRLTLNTVAEQGDDCYLYIDKGAGYFGDFVLNFEFLISAQSAGTQIFMPLVFISGFAGVASMNFTEASMGAYYMGGTWGPKLSLWERWAGDHFEICLPAFNTLYYCTLKRTALALSLDVYTDAGRTSAFANLTRTMLAAHSCRYLYAGSSWGTGDPALWLTGYIQNLELNPSAQTPVVTPVTEADVDTDIVGIQYAAKKPFTAPLESYNAIYATPRILRVRGASQVNVLGGAFKVERT